MSKPRFFWYHVVKQVAVWSLRGQLADDCWLLIFVNSCVKAAYERTRKRKDGKRRCQAVDLLLKKERKKVSGVAMQLFVEERTVVRYISEFVYDVAEEMGIYHRE